MTSMTYLPDDGPKFSKNQADYSKLTNDVRYDADKHVTGDLEISCLKAFIRQFFYLTKV